MLQLAISNLCSPVHAPGPPNRARPLPPRSSQSRKGCRRRWTLKNGEIAHTVLLKLSNCKVKLISWGSFRMPFIMPAAATAKSLQSCPTLCDPIDSSPRGSPIPGILQARTLEWVAISFSSAWKWKVKVKLLSCVWLFATPWTAAYQAPPSMGFSRQEYWSGVPSPSLIMPRDDQHF